MRWVARRPGTTTNSLGCSSIEGSGPSRQMAACPQSPCNAPHEKLFLFKAGLACRRRDHWGVWKYVVCWHLKRSDGYDGDV